MDRWRKGKRRPNNGTACRRRCHCADPSGARERMKWGCQAKHPGAQVLMEHAARGAHSTLRRSPEPIAPRFGLGRAGEMRARQGERDGVPALRAARGAGGRLLEQPRVAQAPIPASSCACADRHMASRTRAPEPHRRSSKIFPNFSPYLAAGAASRRFSLLRRGWRWAHGRASSRPF